MYMLHANELEDPGRYITDMSSVYFTPILRGRADGIVWGDSARAPRFLLVWSPYQEGFQLMGAPLSEGECGEVRHWFEKEMVPFLIERDMDWFEYGADATELERMFCKVLEGRSIGTSDQYIYHWKQTKTDIMPPEGYEIRKVDRALLQDTGIDRDFILEELEAAYGDAQRYFEGGTAYVAIADKEIVARADMLFWEGAFGNISVSTKEQHRRKGLSAYLTKLVIEDTRKLGLTPIWDCTQDNIASQRTAEKTGFEYVRKETISFKEIER